MAKKIVRQTKKEEEKTQKAREVDRVFLGIIIALLIIGVLVFVSASFGILAKSSTKFYGVLFNQLILGLGLGLITLSLASKIPYPFWKKYSLYIFIGSIVLTALVFVPGLGFSHGGARRWISIGPLAFQPVELLKFAFVIYFATWLSWMKNQVRDIKFGIIPLVCMLGIIALVLFKQPDTKSFILILTAGIGMYFITGVKWKYIFGIIGVGLVALVGLVSMKPYLLDRVHTFLDPSRDPSGSSYQLQQSLIAIGSGGVFGRGYGQSVQKFSYLPEPQGDSIFAVIGEEFGFLGSVLVIILYVALALRGLRIANRMPDQFGRLLVSGIIILLTAQSFLNIASIIGVFPLTGVPLVFISHGGTSLMITLTGIGIVLNASRYQKRNIS